MERRTVGKPYWKAIENFPRHKEVIDRLSRKYDAVLARYPYKSGKYQLEEEDFFAELILQCREAEFCSGGSFLERDCRAIDADLHERMLQARKLYTPYRSIWINAMARARLRSAHGWTSANTRRNRAGAPIWGLPFVIA